MPHFKEQWTFPRGIINRSVVVYLDVITSVYSINRCRKYGISLNHKRSIFTITEGKFLGYIISKEGIIIVLERFKLIAQLALPHNKKAMQSFFGKIFFIRNFIPNFAKTVRPFQLTIKKTKEFKCSSEGREYSEKIKTTISNAHVLYSLDFSKYFCLYTFAYDLSIDIVLTQKNEDDKEQPISFMSTNLHETQLKYPTIEK